MTYRQESETDEEREKNPFDARPTYFSYVTSGKRVLTKLFAVSDS